MKSNFSRRAFIGAAAGALALASVTSGIGPADAQSGQVVSRVEALKASKDKIVLYYGSGVQRVDSVERVLDRRGYPTEMYAGAPPGTVQLLVNKHIYGTYDQDSVDGGGLGADAMAFYNEQVGLASGTPTATLR